ncbi:MAG: twin-arginine translocase subunit TatC [Sumerlaeia bacterium]
MGKKQLSLSHLHEEKNLSFLEHLEELRFRLILSVIAIGVGMILGLIFAKPVNEILIQPFRQSTGIYKDSSPLQAQTIQLIVNAEGVVRMSSLSLDDSLGSGTLTMQRLELFREGQDVAFATFEGGGAKTNSLGYFRPMDPFVIYFKTAFLIGFILALPFLVFQIYSFVSPGLLPKERQAIVPLFLLAAVLFPAGAAFAFFLMKYMIYFLTVYALQDVQIFNDIKAYLSFALMMILAFGILFELPVVVVLLTRLGIVSVDTLAAKRKIIFIGILVVAAAIIPGGDPFTLFAMTIPLYVLFELALIMSRIGSRKVEIEENSTPDQSDESS